MMAAIAAQFAAVRMGTDTSWFTEGKLPKQCPNPKIAAEKLLRSVLPEDLCISLSAIGECEVQGKKHRYKIFKGKKTHCTQNDKVFSCCIGLSDTTTPDTDRIVAEFLLIKNDEEQYLKTANLTQIAGPRENHENHEVDAMRHAGMMGQGLQTRMDVLMGFGTLYPRDTIQVRMPGRYEIRPEMITMEVLRLMGNEDRLRGHRWPELSEAEERGFPFQRDYIQVEEIIDPNSLSLRFDEFSARFLRGAAVRLADLLTERPNIFAFLDLPLYNGRARSVDHRGMKIYLTMINANALRFETLMRFTMGLLLR